MQFSLNKLIFYDLVIYFYIIKYLLKSLEQNYKILLLQKATNYTKLNNIKRQIYRLNYIFQRVLLKLNIF